MNWINTLSLPQWLLLAAIPPAVLSLYFLKLKRRELVVPSTLLWRRAIEDLHVNSIWQRLRQNLLLYLQLLFLALLILACIRPGWSGMSRIGERSIYIIDNSASMQANDETPSRLELAKAKVRQLISDTSSDDVGMVIAFSDRADVRQGFTSDRRRLLDSVNSIEPTSHATDAKEALRAAAGLANPGRTSFEDNKDIQVADAIPATVFLITDGAIGELGETDYGQLKIKYVPIGAEGTGNVGIVGFSVQRNDENPQELETYARVVNNSTERIECTASLYLNDNLVDAAAVKIDAEREAGIRFELHGVDEGKLKLELDCQDALAVDNVAYAAIRPHRQLTCLLVTPGNKALETAMKTGRVKQVAEVRVEPPRYLDSPEYAAADADSVYDLIVFDQCAPKKMPQSNTLFVGSVPPSDINGAASLPKPDVAKDATDAGKDASKDQSASNETSKIESRESTAGQWMFGPVTGPLIVLDVNRSSTITQYLEMSAVSIIEGRTVSPPETGSILLMGDVGPLMAIAPRGPYQDAVLGFSLVNQTDKGVEVNTNWSNRRSFPVFVYSAVEYLGGGITEASAPTVQPGWPIGLSLSNRFKDYQVIGPDGKSTQVERSNDGRFLFTHTDVPGAYEVRAQGLERPVEMFCSNLFSGNESNLAIGKEINAGADKIARVETSIRARQETWRWILLVGLVLLMFEWIVFNKRIFV